MSDSGPRFIAFISRPEEIRDYADLIPHAEFVFASLSACDPAIITVDPASLEDAIGRFRLLHAAKPFAAILNRKEKCVVPAAQLAVALNLPPITLKPELARDKHQMRQALNQGSSYPRSILIRKTCDLERVSDGMFPCVLKPRYGFNSRSAVLVNDRMQLHEAYEEQYKSYSALEKQDRTNSDFVVEDFIPGSEHTIESLVVDGVPLFHLISDKLPMKSPYFVEIGDRMPSRLPASQQQACRAATEQALDRLAIRNGWTHTEIKISDLGAIVIECAARMGGGYFETLYREVYGLDRLRVLACLFSGRDSLPIPVAKIHATARRVVVYGPSKMRFVANVETLFHEKNVRLLWPASVSEINRELAGPPVDFNNTLFEFVAFGSSADEADLVAERLLDRVEVGSLC
jgi:biotin carboxylase